MVVSILFRASERKRREFFIIKKSDIDMTRLLSSPCDAWGKPIGGGYKHCPKCNIYLFFMCKLTLTIVTNEFPAKCPMSGEELS